MSEFPKEKYLDLDNNPYLMGRITIYLVKEDYHAEVDIIHRESHKIFQHVDILYHLQDEQEAVISGVQRLRVYLDMMEKKQNG